MRHVIKIHISQIAQARGIKSAYALQKALDVPPSMAAKLWKGDFKMIGIDTINRLCNTLQCTPSDIFKHMPDKNP